MKKGELKRGIAVTAPGTKLQIHGELKLRFIIRARIVQSPK